MQITGVSMAKGACPSKGSPQWLDQLLTLYGYTKKNTGRSYFKLFILFFSPEDALRYSNDLLTKLGQDQIKFFCFFTLSVVKSHN